MTLLSIVVPCYNEEETILSFYQEVMKIKEQMPPLNFEFIFVNDGSSDNTLKQLKILENKDPKQVKYLSFSRNCEGEPKIRSFFAKKFYKIINKISDVQIVDGARDFRLMTRQMVDAILELQEYNRFSKGLFSWVGFDTFYLEYENVERQEGKSSWSFGQLFMYSLDGIIAFSEFPLIISAVVGMLSFILAIIALIFIVVRALIFGDPTSGWPSLVCIILALGGLQLFCLGILGQYLGKTFLETKKRPIYILKEKSDSLTN